LTPARQSNSDARARQQPYGQPGLEPALGICASSCVTGRGTARTTEPRWLLRGSRIMSTPHLRTNRKIIGAAVSGPLSRCTAYRSAADSGALCALRRAKPSQRHSFITIERGYSKVELSGLHPNNAWVLCSHLWNSCSASRAGQLCARDSSRSCTLN